MRCVATRTRGVREETDTHTHTEREREREKGKENEMRMRSRGVVGTGASVRTRAGHGAARLSRRKRQLVQQQQRRMVVVAAAGEEATRSNNEESSGSGGGGDGANKKEENDRYMERERTEAEAVSMSSSSTMSPSSSSSSSSSSSAVSSSSVAPAARAPGPGEVELPVVPSPCVAFPAERFKMKVLSPNLRAALSSVIQNPRGKRIFCLVNSDHVNGTLESVGSKCLLTHLTPASTEEPMTAAGLVLGRCRIEHITQEKPYVTAITRSFHDDRPTQISDEARDAVAECRVCDLLRSIQEASSRLDDDDLFIKIDPAVRHWAGFVCDDVCHVAGMDEDDDDVDDVGGSEFEERMYRSEEEETDAMSASGAGRSIPFSSLSSSPFPPSGLSGTNVDFDAVPEGVEKHNPYITTAHRRELFSFALLRCLSLDTDQLQMFLASTSTLRRLRAGEEKLKQARRYYAAKQSIIDASLRNE